MRVTICGGGVVGQVTGRLLHDSHVVVFHDPPKGLFVEDEADVVIVATPCVDGWFDDVDYLRECGAANIVVRSTVAPPAIVDLQRTVGSVVHHWPEFLTMASADHDARFPDKIVWGSWTDSEASLLRALVGVKWFASWEDRLVVADPSVTTLIKLAVNGVYAAKCWWMNMLFDAVGGSEDDYRAVCDALALDHRLVLSHHDIWQDGFRGAGGGCLAKDIGILASVAPEPYADAIRLISEQNRDLVISTGGHLPDRGSCSLHEEKPPVSS